MPRKLGAAAARHESTTNGTPAEAETPVADDQTPAAAEPQPEHSSDPVVEPAPAKRAARKPRKAAARAPQVQEAAVAEEPAPEPVDEPVPGELEQLRGQGLLVYAMRHAPTGAKGIAQLNLRVDADVARALTVLASASGGATLNKTGNAVLRAALVELGALTPAE